MSQAKLLRAAMLARAYIGDPKPPIELDHICGTPDACCDMECLMSVKISIRNRIIEALDEAIAEGKEHAQTRTSQQECGE